MAGSPKKASPTKKGSPKKGGKRGKKNAGKRRRTRRETYGGYIYRVLKQVHPPRWNLDKSDEYHELLRQRPLRKSRLKSVETGQKQDDVFARNSDFSTTPASRRTGEACCQRRNQSCYEVHELEVIRSRENQKALFRATHTQNKLLAVT